MKYIIRNLRLRKYANKRLKRSRMSEKSVRNVRRKTKRLREYQEKPKHHFLAPPNLSILVHPQEYVTFINDLRDAYKTRKRVLIVLNEIKSLSPESLFVLQSLLCNREFYNDQVRNGTFPNDGTLQGLMLDSGFLGMLQTNSDKFMSSHNGSRVVFKDDMQANGEVASRIIEDAYRKLNSGAPSGMQFDSSYSIIMELMGNVTEHAGGDKPLSQRWYLFAYSDPQTRRVSFTFLDHGVGIFNTLEPKLTSDTLAWLMPSRRVNLLEGLFTGEHKRTHSGDHFRGKGLPKVYNKYQHADDILALAVLTENVFINFGTGNRVLLDSSFAGTALFWSQQW